MSRPRSAVVPAGSRAVAVAPFTDLSGPSVLTTGRRAVEDAIEAGRRQGYADGFQSGLDAARREAAASENEHEQRVQHASQALLAAADQLTRREALALDAVADAITRGAVALAEAILGREVAAGCSTTADAIVRALGMAPVGDATIRLHPDDVRQLEKLDGDTWPVDLAPGRSLVIIADPAIEPGGCVADVGPCRIDAQISTALSRVREALA